MKISTLKQTTFDNEVTSGFSAKLTLVYILYHARKLRKLWMGREARAGAISCSFGYNKEAATFDEWQPLITGAANLSRRTRGFLFRLGVSHA